MPIIGCGYEINNIVENIESVLPNPKSIGWRNLFFTIKEFLTCDGGTLDLLKEMASKNPNRRINKTPKRIGKTANNQKHKSKNSSVF